MINAQFLQNCQSGEEDAIESLVRAYQRPVFQIALSVLDDTPSPNTIAPAALEQAEKATRETFITAIDRMNRYREDMQFDTWLYAIAVQVSRRRYHQWRLVRGVRSLFTRLTGRLAGSRAQEGLYQVKPPPEPISLRAQPLDAALWQAVRGLPEAQRLAVVLRYYHEMSVADIARVLRISEGAVHARLDAARERIAKDPRSDLANA